MRLMFANWCFGVLKQETHKRIKLKQYTIRQTYSEQKIKLTKLPSNQPTKY